MAQRARDGFIYNDERGIMSTVRTGEAYPDDHYAVRTYPHLFYPIDHAESDAPVERRSKSTGRARAAAEAGK